MDNGDYPICNQLLNISTLAAYMSWLTTVNVTVSVASLSQYKEIINIDYGHTLISNNIFLSHYASLPVIAITINSNFMVEWDMHVCFLDARDIASPLSHLDIVAALKIMFHGKNGFLTSYSLMVNGLV